jgi:hypothetical protein
MSGLHILTPGYTGLRASLLEQKAMYGQNIKVFSVGHSVLGRSIHTVGFGNIRNATLFVGGIGAQDWHITLLLTQFFRHDRCMKDGDCLAG